MMRNLLFLFLFLSSFTVSAQPQNINIKHGVSISTLDWRIGEYDFSALGTRLVSYTAFIGFDYAEHKYFYLSSDIGYIRKGTDDIIDFYEIDGQYSNERKNRVAIDYLSINTTFNGTYPLWENLFPYLNIGPRIDMVVKYTDGFKETNQNVKDVNFGMVFGGGIKYHFTNFQIGLCSNYNWNFNKVGEWTSDYLDLEGTIDDYTYSIQLIVGYVF